MMTFPVIKQKAAYILESGMNTIRRLSIFKRLVLSFLLIILIPNLIIGYNSFNISSQEMEKSISGSTRQILRNVSSNINGKLTVYESLAARINSDVRLRELLGKCSGIEKTKYMDQQIEQEYMDYKRQIGNILYQTASSFDIINLEILSDSDEFTEVDYLGKVRGGSLKDAEAYRRSDNYSKAVAAGGAPVWADTSREIGVFRYEDSSITHIQNHITLLECIPDIGQNKPFGVIIINIPVTNFDGMIELKNMYAGNEMLLLTGEYGIVSVLNNIVNIVRIDALPDGKLLTEISALKAGTITREISGNDTLLVFDTLNRMGMSVVYAVRKDEIFSGVYLIRNIILEVAFLCILCAFLLSWFVTASISVPLNRLKNAMERVGESGLNLEYIDNHEDEIGVLSHGFKVMMSRIKDLLDTLIEKELLRKNEEIRRKRAELNALQMQIDPHFLYNTLDLIRCNAMLEENGEGKISKMIASFSNLLRFNTIKTEKLVDINEEIEHIFAYAEVLKSIKKLNLSVELEIEDPAICNNKITKLTFQPIVENAIKHGLTGMDSEGVIHIHIYKRDGDVYAEIRDNGAGISEGQLKYLNGGLENGDLPDKSIGLRNINERIRLAFGEEYGLSIASEEGKYTSVIIHIPDITGE